MTLTIDPAARATAACDDGRVLMHTGTGQICSLNAMGSRIWTELEAGRSLANVAAMIAAEYGVPAERVEADVRAFVAQLTRSGYVRLQGAAS